jgi:sugar phosphate permease
VLAGRWAAVAGLRWSITLGSLLLAIGLFLAPDYLSPNPSYGPLVLVLAIAGIGIGTTVVPITSSVLSAVPAERSGMAASATNTSREIGAVTGAAILGSLMFSRLYASLTGQIIHHHLPPAYRGLVSAAIETGNFTLPPGMSASVKNLIRVLGSLANTAFHDGLRAVLYLAAGLALTAALLASITLRHRPIDAGP